MSTKAEYATKLHENGCNCAQAVACSFCREFGIDENEMFRIAEGFSWNECYGNVGSFRYGYDHRTFQQPAEIPKKVPAPKVTLTKSSAPISRNIKKKNGSCICRELKGVETGKVFAAASSVSQMRLILQKNILRKTDNLIKIKQQK